MYALLKKIFKSIVPASLIDKLTPSVREIYSKFYTGSNVFCSICERSYRKFILLDNNRDLLCPGCGSLPRYRLLNVLLKKKHNLQQDKLNILHFSPAKSLKRKLKNFKNLNYITCNYNTSSEDKDINITSINEPSHYFDMVICFHVLEHINEDLLAMDELYRILKTNGVAYIQTPFKEGDIYENASITSAEDRVKHFGQDDHVRVYSIQGLSARLKHAGFNVNTLKATEICDQSMITHYGIIEEDVIFECRK
jgi:SAM-dependent methyltransferase